LASIAHHPQAIRPRVVIAWAGIALLGLGAAMLYTGRATGGTEALLLAGAYATTGAFVLIAGSIRA
jgi:hypothetical protein